MNKLLVTISLVLFTTFSFAQTITYGIKAGANLSTVAFSGSTPGLAIDNQNRAGYQIGATVDIGFQHFSIQPGLFYITKGEKYVTENVYKDQTNLNYGAQVYGNTRYNYLELPVNFLYKMQVSPTVKIYAGGGPYIGYGINGTTNASYTEGASSGTNKFGVTFGRGGYKDNKLLDYGINFAEGVEINKHYTIDLNYSLGIRNISHDIDDAQFRNRTLSLSVGYLF